VDQKSLDDTRYNHDIIVRIIFKLKIFLGEGNWDVRPLGSDEGSLHPNMLHSSELEPHVIGSTSFMTKGATTWLLYEAIITNVEVSSPEVGANVGPCSQMLYTKNKAIKLLLISTFILRSIISLRI
jgi:predicted  nucleic acid-binding Zn ribbon protein